MKPWEKVTYVALAPNGVPWRALLAGLVVGTVSFVLALLLFPGASRGGIFVVTAMIAMAVFSALLG